MKDSKGIIHSFESLGALDGKGIRFIIFFQGCYKRCVYCHNPDTWDLKGKSYSVEEVVKRVLRYQPYFKTTGGVTLSGGECLIQEDFVLKLCQELKRHSINISLDTSGIALTKKVKNIILLVDNIIFDFKMTTEEEYQKFIKSEFNEAHEFLKYLSLMEKSITIRTVIIPGINDTDVFIERLALILRPYKLKAELIPYHDYGKEKYALLGIKYVLEAVNNLDPKRLIILQKLLDSKIK
ncbi:MAG: radical SAM protein [Erysipelotrichales bacterium]|nr:radical SAM protein [Erysipelotrichales bacterium]